MGKSILLAEPDEHEAMARRALDPDSMLEAFQRALPALAREPIRVTRCRIKTLKSGRGDVSRGTRLLYRVSIESTRGQRWEHTILGTAPVSVEPEPGARAGGERAAVGHPALEPFEEPWGYIADLRMALRFFPVDPAMPSLLEVTRPDCGSLLAPFIADAREGATIERVAFDLKRYKPANRCVLRVTAQVARGRTRTERAVYIKFFSDDRGARIHRTFKALWEVARHATSLRLPEPLGYDPGRRMLVMAEAPGARDLSNWIKCLERDEPLPPGVDSPRLDRCMAEVARGLAELHGSRISLPKQRTFRDELADRRKDLACLEDSCPQLWKRADDLLRRLEDNAPAQEDLVPSHGGFRHKQTVGNERCLTVVDWDGLTMAPPAFDAANFLARLNERPLGRPPAARPMERLAHRFRQCVLQEEPGLRPRDLTWYECLALAEKAMRSFRRPRRGARHESEAHHLLRAAHRMFDEGLTL